MTRISFSRIIWRIGRQSRMGRQSRKGRKRRRGRIVRSLENSRKNRILLIFDMRISKMRIMISR